MISDNENYKTWVERVHKAGNGLDRVMNCASLINHMHSRIFSAFHDREIRQATYNVLVILKEFGEATSLKDIAEKNPVAIGDLSRLCDRLVDGGYIERASDRKQGVRTVIHLTAKGEEHLAAFDEFRRALLLKVFGKDEAELNRVADTMEELILSSDLRLVP